MKGTGPDTRLKGKNPVKETYHAMNPIKWCAFPNNSITATTKVDPLPIHPSGLWVVVIDCGPRWVRYRLVLYADSPCTS